MLTTWQSDWLVVNQRSRQMPRNQRSRQRRRQRTHGRRSRQRSQYSMRGRSKLKLGLNKVGSRGATALAVTMRGWHTLKVLNLHGNHIGADGAAALASAFAASASLVTADLLGNAFDIASAEALAAICKERRIFLAGIREDQKKASWNSTFKDAIRLGPPDGILLACDLATSTSLQKVS